MTSDGMSRAKAAFAREAERVRAQVREGEAEAERAREQAKVEPAEDADHALAQIDEIRDRIDRDLGVLESRLPPRDVLAAQARTVGGAAVAGVAVLTVLGVVRRRRKTQRDHERDLRIQAAEIARFLPGALDPDRDPDRADDSGRDGEDAGGTGRGGVGRGGVGRLLRTMALVAAAGAVAFAAFRRLRPADEPPDLVPPAG